MPFLHLPIQSGSDKILKKMNRKHSIKKYYKIVDKLKSWRPDIALSSDFIVGFPEETNEDFDKTMEFVENVNFAIAYSFMFSPRPGTPAFKLKDIDRNIKKARLSALQSLLKQQQVEFNKSFINKEMDILFEKEGRHNNQYIGRTIYNQSVFTKYKENLISKFKKATITRSTNFALECQV